jgi:hypothetical protein
MRLNFTNHQLSSGKHGSTTGKISVRKLFRITLFLGVFYFSSVTSEAQTMWAQSRTGAVAASSQFKVNFNITNGTLHVETFAHHPDYWIQSLTLSHYMAYIRNAILFFTTDGVSWTPFYQFGFVQNNISYSIPYPPFSMVTGITQVDNAQIINVDLSPG